MQTFELRSLLQGKKRKVNPTGELLMSFEEFKKLCAKNEVTAKDFDFFCAGYFLANPIFREQFLAEKKMELRIEKIMKRSYAPAQKKTSHTLGEINEYT